MEKHGRQAGYDSRCLFRNAIKYTDPTGDGDKTRTCEDHIQELGVAAVCDIDSVRDFCCDTCLHLPDCPAHQATCLYSGECLAVSSLCDGVADCSNATDEVNCTVCQSDTSPCETGGQCVKQNKVCDGTSDCGGSSDEDGCDLSGSEKEVIVEVTEALFSRKKYNKRVRPVARAEDVLNVTMEIQLKSMFDVNENDQTMTTMCLILMQWRDDFLHWSEGRLMRNVSSIQVKQKDVWVPDVMVGNIVSDRWHLGDKEVNLRIDRTGLVTWVIHAYIVSECEIAVEHFPFDTQICSLEFTTEQSPQEEIRLINYNDVNNHSALHVYGEDGTWEMLGYHIESGSSQDGRHRPVTTFFFHIARRQTFYLVSFIAPVIFLSFTACLVFVLPADAGEKMGTSLTVLLAYSVYLTLVTDYLPDTSLQVSYLALYLTVLLGLCTTSAFLTTFILHVYHFPEDRPVGPKVSWLTRKLQQITCYGSNNQSQQRRLHDSRESPGVNNHEEAAPTSISHNCNSSTGEVPGTNENLTSSENKGTKYTVTPDVEEPLDWKTVSKTFDWFFYLSFGIIVLLVTLGYVGVAVYGGVVVTDRHNETGTLLPTFGRKNTRAGLAAV